MHTFNSYVSFCIFHHLFIAKELLSTLGPVAQLVASPTADPGVANLIPAQSHTLVEINNKIIFTVILLLLLIQEGLLLLLNKFKSSSNFFTERSKVVLLLRILFMSPGKHGLHIRTMTLSAVSSLASHFWFQINNF